MDNIRYNKIELCECINGENGGVTLGTQGCEKHCPGCQNPETGDLNGGQILIKQDEDKIYKTLSQPQIQRFSISGGESLLKRNLPQLSYILCTIKSNWPDKKVWIGTGYTWDELQEKQKELNPNYLQTVFKYTDYLITGPFIQEEKDLTLQGRGSRNQEVLNKEEIQRRLLNNGQI